MRDTAAFDNSFSSSALQSAETQAGRSPQPAHAALSGERPANSFLPPAPFAGSLADAGQLAALSSPPGEGAADPLSEQRERWKAARARMGAPVAQMPVVRLKRKEADVVSLPDVSQKAASRGWANDEAFEWFYHGFAAPRFPFAEEARRIIRAAAREFSVPASEIVGSNRTARVVFARYVAIHRIARAFPSKSSTQIGKAVGQDHSSVLFALGRLKKKPRQLYDVMVAA